MSRARENRRRKARARKRLEEWRAEQRMWAYLEKLDRLLDLLGLKETP